MPDASHQILDAALEYAARGWPVHPCTPGDKRPTLKDWPTVARTDADTIRRWWADTPDANIGVVTGTRSSVWVLDLDGPAGLADLDRLEAQHGTLPPTRVHCTPSGGGHYLFAMPAGLDLRNRAKIGGMNIDVRASGGYVVAPPSKTLKGAYTVATDHAIADAPQWLLDLVVRPSTPAPATPSLQPTIDIGDSDRVRRARAYLDKIPGGVDGEHGSNPCLWAASVLVWGYCLDRGTARQLMGEYSARCSPPWSEKEIEHKLDDAAKGGIGKPQGWLLDAPRPERNAAPSASSAPTTTEPDDADDGWIDSAEFDAGDYRPEFLIERVLVAIEPAVLAAPTKSMKTSLGVDACISMASGTPFLGTFPVPAPIKVAIASMESGRSTLQGTMRRVCSAKGITPADVGDNLIWRFDVPVLSDLGAVGRFAGSLVKRGVRAVLLDPLYLCLGDVDAKDMFQVGAVLRSVASMLTPNGITPIIVHHANRQVPAGEPMGLEHIAYSGTDAFARQFWLMNRREKYRLDGEHKLWLSVGGSAGHGGLYAVDVSEGITDRDFGGRRWDVTVTDAAELRQDAAEDREAKAAAKVREKMAAENEKLLAGIDAETQKGQPAATKNKLREYTGWKTPQLDEVLDRLLDDDKIEPHDWMKPRGKNSKHPTTGYRRPVVSEQANIPYSDHPGKHEGPDDIPASPDDAGSSEGTSGDHAGGESPLKGDSPAPPDDPEPRELEATPKTGRRRKAKSPACSRKTGAA